MVINSYSLKITAKAYDDLDEIYNYITKKFYNELAAEHLMDKIESNFLRLKEFPFSCNLVTDEFLRIKGYRKLIIDSYIAFFIVDDDKKQIIILRVLYGSQKYQDII